MREFAKWLFFCVCVMTLLFKSVAAKEEDRRAPAGQLSDAQNTALRKNIDRLREKLEIPGVSAVIVKNGKVAWTGAFGLADVKTKRRVTPDTGFMLASVSKTVTATALMTLHDAGKFKLDDDINKYLPFAVRNPNHPNAPITFRQLLTHTSSICDSDETAEVYEPGDATATLRQSLYDYLAIGGSGYDDEENFLEDAPGETYEYSNVGNSLVGLLVETISGQSFESYCQKAIFKPLGMTNTAWRLKDLDAATLALPYSEGETEGHYGYPDIPCGALRTSAPQLAKFLLMFMNRGEYNGVRVLSKAAVEEMARVQFPELEDGQGLAWYYETFGRRELLGHNGADTGVSTNMFFDIKSGLGVIVLCNADEGADEIVEAILRVAKKL